MQLTLLIVDDDNDDIALFCDAVREINNAHRCITASDGREALRLLQHVTRKPDFIFLDLNLPFMNGKECLTAIKKRPEFINIPVIIYSTSKLKTDRDEVYKLGAARFLTKPSSFREIVKTISYVLTQETGKMITNKRPEN